MDRATRRQFLEQVTRTTTGLLAAGYTASARGFQANETIHIGCVGTGGRCRRLMQALAGIAGVRITAVCDVWDVALAEAKKLADPQAYATKAYEQLLERKDVDAVIIATSDHWHARITVDAAQAEKDVYVEKPLTHDLSEGSAILAAQNRYRRVIQVGMQQRSMPHIREALEIVRSGQLGTIHKVHLTWNRNQPRGERVRYGIDPATVDWKRFLGSAPDQPFDEYRFRNWRWFWDFGGGIFTDLMVHWIDVAHWFLELDHPESAASVGAHVQSSGLWETPDTVQTLLQYTDKEGRPVQAHFEGTFYNARQGAMIEFLGSEATLYIDRGRYEVHPERKKKIAYRELILGRNPDFRGADFYDQPDGETLHLANWLECVRSRQRPYAPVEAGVSAAAAAHLANIALRSTGVARWKDVVS
jgi:predicted dehydrogenase